MKQLIVIGVVVLVVGGMIVVLERLAPGPTGVPGETATTTESSDAFTDASGASFRWQGGVINTRAARIPPGRRITETLYLGPSAETVIELRSAGEVEVSLTAPSGEEVALAATMALDEQSGETIALYTVPAHRQSGEWQLSVENNDQAATTSVDISTPVATPPLNVVTDTPPVNAPGSEIVLTLTVEETSADGLVVQTVSGASVVAVITAPDGTVTTVVLTEDPEHPGTYTGEYPDPDQPGVYEVEYIITGTNNEGQEFTQITTSQFVVTGAANPAASSSAGWNKKYDINRSDQINIINY